MYTKPMTWGALALSAFLLAGCGGGGGGDNEGTPNTPVAPSSRVEAPVSPVSPQPEEPATPVDVTEDYKQHFMGLMAGTYQGYGSKAPSETPSPCAVTLTTVDVSTMGASYDVLRPTVQLSIWHNDDGYHLMAGTISGVPEVAAVSWNFGGIFSNGLVTDSTSVVAGSVCSQDDRVSPGTIQRQVSFAREVAALLALRHDSFPAGSCLSTAPGGTAKLNDRELAIEIVNGATLQIGDQSFELDIGSKTDGVSLTAQKLQRVLELTTESISGTKYILQMTKPHGMHAFSYTAANGASVLCAKKIGG